MGCFIGIHNYNWMSSAVNLSGWKATTTGARCLIFGCDYYVFHLLAPLPSPRVASSGGHISVKTVICSPGSWRSHL